MKYGDLTLGQIEAIVNKLGGMEGTQRLLAGDMQVTEIKASTPPFQFDMAEERCWTLANEGLQHPKGLTIAGLELINFFHHSESSIKLVELGVRSNALAPNLGQHTAEYLFEHRDSIPKGWQRFYFPFPGTTWLDRKNHLHFPYLAYADNWSLRFDWFGPRCSANGRLVRPRPRASR